MSYRVVKWVKGRAYLYDQTSYRVGRKVRTTSRYVGPATAATHAPSSKVMASPGERASPVQRKVTLPEGASEPMIEADLGALRIGREPLRNWHVNAMRSLDGLGMDLSKVPPVTVKHGLSVRVRKGRFGGGYVVTLPRGQRGNRNAVRDAYGKALAATMLDGLQEQRPDLHQALALHFDQSYRATTRAVMDYIANSRDRNKWALVLTAWAWGKVSPVYADRSGMRSRFIAPRMLGLQQWGERKDWRADAEATLGAVLRKGYGPERTRHSEEWKKARFAERNAEEAFRKARIGKRGAARKTWRRAQARVSALREQAFALETLNGVFGLDAQEPYLV
ncbi:hypothetical protein [Rhodospirillum sp. A1_3_36]|uniref:hypothetical protein n=1 Tax=Rhodospirillum sp. A1_3_36 TaxID=3391666 RepID=UPI0039A77416